MLADRMDDWDSFAEAARRHQLDGFALDRLETAPTVPDSLKARWRREAKNRAMLNLGQGKATKDLHALLRDHGTDNLILKGLPLTHELYGSLGIKRSGDIDFLVDEKDAWPAIQTLSRIGFQPVVGDGSLSPRQAAVMVRHYKEVTLRNRAGIVVDLHWKLVDGNVMFAQLDAFANARRVTIDNLGEIHVLGEADGFAYLCAHGAMSDWSRLKWLCDVNAMLAGRSEAEIIALYNHAETLGAGVSTLQALGLRRLIWDRAMPAVLQDKVDDIAYADFLSFPIDRMIEPYRLKSPVKVLDRIIRQARVRGALYNDKVKAAAEMRHHLRALPDVLAAPLPRALDWLYIPLRPVMWIGRKLRN
ncbi:nucleotidyltransferase family protein [Erythrobacter sp. MTPC3]|uniref:nucleotidyltransferase family protein n=1 Tax=Erythrobacter sp. MTPC3 TaxID=3056564 RepID=UPI0036F312CB